MRWLARLSQHRAGKQGEEPSGFFWQRAGEVALAAGTEWNQNVARECFRRDSIKRIVGGGSKGSNTARAARCIATWSRGRPAVQIVIDGTPVGWIPDEDAADFHAELQAITPAGHATGKAHVAGGANGADYRVRLSVVRPLRPRTI